MFVFFFFFFLMIRRPPRSTLSSSSAASDVYKRQGWRHRGRASDAGSKDPGGAADRRRERPPGPGAVSYTHLRAHETPEHLVCRLLLRAHETPEHLVCRLLLQPHKTPEHLVCRRLLQD